MQPCAKHGAVELWEENRRLWDLFWDHFAPHILTTRWEPQGKQWVRAIDINMDTLRWLMGLYPIEPERSMLDKIRAITQEFWNA